MICFVQFDYCYNLINEKLVNNNLIPLNTMQKNIYHLYLYLKGIIH